DLAGADGYRAVARRCLPLWHHRTERTPAELLMDQFSSIPEPSHYPVSMAGFGVNPFGKFLFRIVYAPSVRKAIFGTAANGETGMHIRPAYRHLGDKWILEKWISGEQATRMTPREYDSFGPRCPQSGMLIEGPYPACGVYHHCWTFDSTEEITGIHH